MLWRLHAIDAIRLQERRSWVVCFLILSPFGPRRDCDSRRLTKKEIKKMTKEIKAKIKSGAELDDDEEAFAEEHELWK